MDGPARELEAVGLGYRTFPAQQFGAGRVCADPDCSTLLSVYNPGKLCSVHEGCRPRPLIVR